MRLTPQQRNALAGAVDYYSEMLSDEGWDHEGRPQPGPHAAWARREAATLERAWAKLRA